MSLKIRLSRGGAKAVHAPYPGSVKAVGDLDMGRIGVA